MDVLSELRRVFRSWIILIGLLLAAIILLVAYLWAGNSRPLDASRTPVAAVITIIPAPTYTPIPPPTPVITPTPVEQVPPSPPPGTFSIGAYVQIVGTGGDGLRLRTEPGLDSQVRLLGAEAEVFQIREGPQDVAGYTWWYLVAPYDESRQGWAVSNYLALIQNP